MSTSPRGSDDETVRRRLARVAADSGRTPDLECIVVRYRDRPDRCTIAPRECPEETRLTHWLSADLSAVVDLEEVR